MSTLQEESAARQCPVNALFEEIRSTGDSSAPPLRSVPECREAHKERVEPGPVSPRALELEEMELEKSQSDVCPEAAGPAFILENNRRWLAKSYAGGPGQVLRLRLDEVRMHHVVCIEDCHHVHVEIQGKANLVSIVRCRKAQIALSSVVSTVEIVGCADTDVQVTKAAPSVTVEDSSSVNIYLLSLEHARETDIFSTRISTVNVLFPSRDDPESMVERPLPEQFVSKIVLDSKKGDVFETKPSRQ